MSFTPDQSLGKIKQYCAYQERCHSEVRTKLYSFGLNKDEVEEIVYLLITENYLNEERFTRSYIRGKFYMKSWGRNKIRNHLKFKGVPEKLINSCFDEIDDQDYHKTLSKLYHDYISKIKGLQLYQKNSKTIKYLLTKGFEYEEITQVIKDAAEQREWIRFKS